MLAWRNGRRNGLKIRWGQPREGSSPFASTIKKVGDIMGKRPYYIINSFVDYDGYDSRVEYIGTNWKAARNRFFTVVELLKQEQFFDHGLTENDIQLVFTDTPGFHKPKTKLGEKMIKSVDDAISGVDSCLFVTESKGEIRPTEIELLERLKKEKIPVILAINKIDAIKKEFDCKKIAVHAQKQAVGFYEKMGFLTVSDEFLEEGIPHLTMEMKI